MARSSAAGSGSGGSTGTVLAEVSAPRSRLPCRRPEDGVRTAQESLNQLEVAPLVLARELRQRLVEVLPDALRHGPAVGRELDRDAPAIALRPDARA